MENEAKKPKRSGRHGKLATIRELADDGNVPYSSVRELMLEGHLPYVVLGKSRVRRAKWEDWDRLIEASTERAEQR